jgi:uncharacterized DUF497 family protein
MEFEWDEAKSQRNVKERGFDFAYAVGIFDSLVIETIDSRRDYGEQRVIALGSVDTGILAVVYTDRHGVRRIISARRANRRECDAYRAHAA